MVFFSFSLEGGRTRRRLPGKIDSLGVPRPLSFGGSGSISSQKKSERNKNLASGLLYHQGIIVLLLPSIHRDVDALGAFVPSRSLPWNSWEADWLVFVCATFISRPGIRRIELILFYIQARSGIINGQEVRD